MLTKTQTHPQQQESKPDLFELGWCLVPRTLANGQIYHERISLTLNDILHPQVGDYRVHNTNHEIFCDYFADVFIGKFHHDPHAVVLHDVRVAWVTPEMDAHAPDISVIFKVKQRKNWSTFDEKEEGVDYYLIVDMKRKNKKEHYVLLGYVLRAGRYEAIKPNQQGWLWLPPVGLWVGIEGNRPYCYDEQGQRVADYTEIKVQLEKEVRIRQQAEVRAETEAAARQQAEDQLREMATELARLRAALASDEK